MLIDKLADGVLEIDTPIGPRYVQPNFAERAYLLWTFRNFFSLPQEVLRPWQQRLVERLWSESRFVSLRIDGSSERPVIGRVERRPSPQADVLPFPKAPSKAQKASGTEREAASA
jgi:hypothetical protein